LYVKSLQFTKVDISHLPINIRLALDLAITRSNFSSLTRKVFRLANQLAPQNMAHIYKRSQCI